MPNAYLYKNEVICYDCRREMLDEGADDDDFDGAHEYCIIEGINKCNLCDSWLGER